MEVGRFIWGLAWGCLTEVIAGLGSTLGVLLFLQAADLATALIANGRVGHLRPEQGWYGWRRKVNTLIFVLSVAVLQQWGPEAVQALPAAQVVCGGFAAVEAVSVMRNLLLTGAALPAFLRAPFAKLVELVEGETGEEEVKAERAGVAGPNR